MKHKFRPGQVKRKRHVTLATKVERLQKTVRRNKIVHRELNYQYSCYASRLGNLDKSAAVACQNISPQPSLGVVFDSRQTPTIRAQSLKIGINPLTSATSDMVRVIVFSTPEPLNGTQTGVDFNPSAGTYEAPFSPLSPSNLNDYRYKVWYDSGPKSMGVTGGLLADRAWIKTIPMKGHQFEYANTGSNSFPIQDNFYLIAYGTQTPGAGPTYITTTVCTIAYQWIFST